MRGFLQEGDLISVSCTLDYSISVLYTELGNGASIVCLCLETHSPGRDLDPRSSVTGSVATFLHLLNPTELSSPCSDPLPQSFLRVLSLTVARALS